MTQLSGEKVAALSARVQEEIDSGRLPGAQLALALDGEVAHAEAFGEAAPASQMIMFSATKPVVASVVWQLIGEGSLDPAKPIADVIPEFGTNGKEAITLEQVMLHTSGFPYAPLGPPHLLTREGRVEKFGRWRTTWEPGSQFEYHPVSAHWVLAELIARITGTEHTVAIRERVLDPLGLDRLAVGLPLDQQGDVLTTVGTMAPAPPAELLAVLGVEAPPEVPGAEEALLSLNHPKMRALGVPGGGGITDASSMALFYQALLHDPKGLWDPAVLHDAKTNVRNTFPDAYGVPANRTLGLVKAGDDGRSAGRGMGHGVSGDAFGHNGAGGQIAWADPVSGLSFVFLTNGMDRHLIREFRRTDELGTLAAACVG